MHCVIFHQVWTKFIFKVRAKLVLQSADNYNRLTMSFCCFQQAICIVYKYLISYEDFRKLHRFFCTDPAGFRYLCNMKRPWFCSNDRPCPRTWEGGKELHHYQNHHKPRMLQDTEIEWGECFGQNYNLFGWWDVHRLLNSHQSKLGSYSLLYQLLDFHPSNNRIRAPWDTWVQMVHKSHIFWDTGNEIF